MNTTRNHARLNELSKQIAILDAQIIETERTALELFDERAWESVILIKAELEKALRAYFIESEVVRRAEHTARQAAA